MAASSSHTSWKDISLVVLSFISMAAIAAGSWGLSTASATASDVGALKAQITAQQKSADDLRSDIREQLAIIRTELRDIKTDIKNLHQKESAK